MGNSNGKNSGQGYHRGGSSKLKVHATVSQGYLANGSQSRSTPLGEATDEELLAEIGRRKINIRTKITDDVVKETYEYGRVLGKGASGTVQEVTHRKTGQHFALKIIHKDDQINDMESMMMEIEIMKRVRHRYVISMYELFETSNCLWMVMELYSGGSMHDYLMKVEQYDENLAAIHTSQMLEGLHYMHSLGIVHRDLKLENILMHDTGGGNMEVKVADFGLSCILPLGEHGYDVNHSCKRKKYDKCEDMWGTREYFAPELISGAYGPQADLWSMGCIIYEMLVGLPAFSLKACGNDEMKLYNQIQAGGYDTSSEEWHRVSEGGRKFLRDLLNVKPTKRLCCEEALEHAWLKERVKLDSVKGEYTLIENTRAYRRTFGESRKVHQKGSRLTKPVRNVLVGLSAARGFSDMGGGFKTTLAPLKAAESAYKEQPQSHPEE